MCASVHVYVCASTHYRSLMCGHTVGHHILPPFGNVTGTTGKIIGSKIFFARDMLDGETEGLHGKVPAGDSAVGILHSLEPQ